MAFGLVLCWPMFASASELRLAVSKSPLSLPFFVAREQKLFEKHNVKLRWIECLGGNRCIKDLVEDRADMATSSELPFMFALMDGNPITMVATFATAKDDMKFIANRNAVTNGVAGLKGKRIGFVARASSHYYKDLFLLYNGLDPKEVVHVPMNADKLPNALLGGEVDAISVWEPWGQITLNRGAAQVVLLEAPKLYTQTFNLSVSNSYLVSGKAELRRLLQAIQEANLFIKTRPAEAKAIMAHSAGLETDLVEGVWPTLLFQLSLQHSLLSTLQGQTRWAKREGHVPQGTPEPDFLNFIDPTHLRQVVPNAVDFAYP